VPRSSSTSRDQAILVDYPTDASLSSDAARGVLGRNCLIGKLEDSRGLGKFTSVRPEFEDFLINYPYFVNQIVQRFGSYMRSVPTILSMYSTIFEDLLEGKSHDEIFDHLTDERSYLAAVTDEDRHHRRISRQITRARLI
jgi:hypothetical protein